MTEATAEMIQEFPFAVCEVPISMCRSAIEPTWKKAARAAMLPYVKLRYGFVALGEGFQWGRDLEIGRDRVAVGRYSFVGARSQIIHPTAIGDLCMISADVTFFGNDHRYDDPRLPTRLSFSSVTGITRVEADVWIGQRAMIRAGVTLGRGCVVGAGAIVTTDIAPYSVVVGCPARVLRLRFPIQEQSERDKWLFDLQPNDSGDLSARNRV